MASFIYYQDQARKRTGLLIALFALSVLGIGLVIWLVAEFAVYYASGAADAGTAWQPNWSILRYTLIGEFLIIGLASMSKISSLSSGGAAVAESMGAREITGEPSSLEEQQLLNVVEEMSIAARIPAPRVFVMDGEPSINAFAAGTHTGDAAVAVTAGALMVFNREELQAVIGHEFSHIVNGDMSMNMKIISVLAGVMMLSFFGSMIMRIGADSLMMQRPRQSSKGKDNGQAVAFVIMIVGVAAWLAGIAGLFFGQLIQAAVSRQREFLADASSVQFTRNPMAMASALKKIGGVSRNRIRSSHRDEYAHLFFTSGAASLFSSHPPLEERIRRFDPGFNGEFPDTDEALAAAFIDSQKEYGDEDGDWEEEEE